MPATVFVSYAHEDEALKNDLLNHLALLRRQGVISTWQDRQLPAGTEFDREIRTQLETADVILLLVSANFLASEYIWSVELKRALERHEARTAHVIPVILRSCDWHTAPFAKLTAAPTDGKAVTSWANLDEAFTDIAKHIRNAVIRLNPDVIVRISNLPPRNPNFTGRRKLLRSIHDGFSSHPVQALNGMGGVGKTQLAIHYARQYLTEYTFMWWIRAEQPSTLASDYAALAERLQLPEHTLADQNAIIEAVRRHLETMRRWLLIFDNAEKPEDVQPYLPSGEGHVLITSRNPAWRGVAEPIAVDVMDRADSIALILHRSGTTELTAADALAEELGDLPLAIEQASAYMEQTAIPPGEYIQLFRTQRKELWKRETRSVATTWKLSIDKSRRCERRVRSGSRLRRRRCARSCRHISASYRRNYALVVRCRRPT